MIHIFFVCGMYGHMIDYVINRHDDRIKKGQGLRPQFDGSMHHGLESSLSLHCSSIKDFDKMPQLLNKQTSAPCYPLGDAKFNEVVQKVSSKSPSWAMDKKILLASHNLESAALNMLFQFHKVANGVRNAGLEIFYGNVPDSPFKSWNQNYTGFSCMRVWEFREWFSIAWKGIANDWIVKEPLDSSWLVLDNRQFINQISDHMRLVFAHCDLSWTSDLDGWIHEYQTSQQYILNEFALIDKICHSTVNLKNFCWKELNVIAESLIQSKLCDLGFEIRCQDLDQFPTDTATLSNLLYPIEVT